MGIASIPIGINALEHYVSTLFMDTYMLPGCYFSKTKKEYVRKLYVYTCSKKKTNTKTPGGGDVLRY